MMRQNHRGPLLPLALFVPLALGACQGSIGTEEGGPGSQGPNGTSPTESTPPSVAACQGKTPSPGHVVVHRLNRVEYNNTVRDLLGDTSAPADTFPADVALGFDNNSSALTINDDLLARYERAAERLALAAVNTGKLVTCKPATAADEVSCARKILEPFAHRAWRRPVTPAEVDMLLGFVKLAKDEGDTFSNGMVLAVQRVLLSPDFLYRVEYPDPNSPGVQRLGAHALASRLSYFLWSSMPDPQLLDVADSGALLESKVLGAQIDRMLKDPKTSAMAENLGGQWLLGRVAAQATPDPTKFRTFDDSLRSAIPREPALVLQRLFSDALDLRSLVDTGFTFVNERLARHYGIGGIKGDAFVKVNATAQRGGILTQAAFLVATSKADQPSIPRRGKWVSENLLCTIVPPPPASADAQQKEIEMKLVNPTRRQIAEARDTDPTKPTCAGCHQSLDPVGLALDRYDASAAFRSVDDKRRPIDVDGLTLPGGGMFSGAGGLSKLLKSDSRLHGCITETLFSYALGRRVEEADKCMVQDIADKAVAKGFKIGDVVEALVASPAFAFQAQ